MRYNQVGFFTFLFVYDVYDKSAIKSILRRQGLLLDALCPCGSGKKYKKCCGAKP
jgi:hypothetical protein